MGVLNYTTAKVNELLDKIDKAPDTIENGKTPVFVTGTTTTLDPGLSATAEVVQDGVDENGNPKYKINFGVPKGLDGASGEGGGVADSVQWVNVLNKPSWVNSATKPTYTASEVGALPADTTIPSKTSQLTNDSNFLTSSDFKTINGQPIVGSGNIQIEGGSSGGTGNVNVTNASDLKASEFYAFRPASDGSVGGKFLLLPEADSSNAGLMPAESFERLSSMKACLYFPIAFEQLNSSSTIEEVVQLFSEAIQTQLSNVSTLLYIMISYCNSYNSEGSGNTGKFYIGNNDCLFRGLYTEEEHKLLMEFTYITIGGSLKTISIYFSNIQENLSTEEMTISVIDSENDSYYLPKEVYDLSAISTQAEITAAFGGEEGLASLKDAIRANKKIYVKRTDKFAYVSLLPVSYTMFFDAAWAISFTTPKWGSTNGAFIIKNIKPTEVLEIYQDGYRLHSSFYSLTSNSTSEEISTAVGGEDGLKKLIALIKCGNRILINPSNDINQVTQLLPNVINEVENGNLGVVFFGMGYALWGGAISMIAINYDKTSNTFSAAVTGIGS